MRTKCLFLPPFASPQIPQHYYSSFKGKNPVVIFDDANLEKCLETTLRFLFISIHSLLVFLMLFFPLRSSFTNQGEICLCGSRIFVQSGSLLSFDLPLHFSSSYFSFF